ncbi:dienelactone hydrolase [Panaeolus papilionaceus]|nr:dienelactone hydrolase [Panaeolus papilionaceus]
MRTRPLSIATKAIITPNAQNARYFTQAVQHTGEPKGRNITIAGVETYLAEPPLGTAGPKKVILFFPDVFGPFSTKAQLLQDYFASQGFYVLGLDYFFGDPIQRHSKESNFNRDAWFSKSRELSEKAIPRWVEAVRDMYGVDAKFCAVGYCYGGPYVLQAATTNDVVAAAFAHPTALRGDDFRNLKKPLLLSCAEIDNTFPADKRRQAEDILREINATYLIQVYSGVSHGFATRGDPAVEISRWAKEHCAKSVVEWFKRFT